MGFPGYSGEVVSDCAWVQRLSVRIAEHEVIECQRASLQQPLGFLPGSVLPEKQGEAGVMSTLRLMVTFGLLEVADAISLIQRTRDG